MTQIFVIAELNYTNLFVGCNNLNFINQHLHFGLIELGHQLLY